MSGGQGGGNSKDGIRQVTICVVGKSGAGKTTCIVRYVRGFFQDNLDPTVFDDYKCNFTSPRSGIPYSLKIKDTAGQMEYKDIRLLSYREANAILLCYGINDKNSLDDIRRDWYPELNQYATNALKVPITLAALKCDLRLEYTTPEDQSKLISTKEGKALAKEIGAQYVECSSKSDSIGVDSAFVKILTLLETPNNRRSQEESSSNPIVAFFASIRRFFQSRMTRS